MAFANIKDKIENFVLFIHKSNVHKALFMAGVFPLSLLFAFLLYRMEEEIYFFIAGDKIISWNFVWLVGTNVVYGIICASLAGKKGWFLAGFLFTGVALFYCLLILVQRRYYSYNTSDINTPNNKGDISKKIYIWFVFLVSAALFWIWGANYVISVINSSI